MRGIHAITFHSEATGDDLHGSAGILVDCAHAVSRTRLQGATKYLKMR